MSEVGKNSIAPGLLCTVIFGAVTTEKIVPRDVIEVNLIVINLVLVLRHRVCVCVLSTSWCRALSPGNQNFPVKN